MQQYSRTPARVATTSMMVPVTPTAIPTVAPVLRLVSAISVLRIVGALGVVSVLGVVCVMIPDEKKNEKIFLSNDPSYSLKVLYNSVVFVNIHFSNTFQ